METASPETLAQAAAYLKKADPILAPLIDRPANIVPHKNYYQELVESIVSQQLSVKAAATILKRFVAIFGDDFPAPDEVLKKDIEELRGVGLSRQKGSYIQDLALKVIEGEVRFNHLDALTNDEVIAELIKIKGVGLWTVHMFLIFSMGRLDVLPTGDLGIKNGVQKLYGLEKQPTEQEIVEIALKNKWHPYESAASWYVWKSLNNTPAID
jgi:DNA-3-methyladenine glycosylase II